MTELLNMLFIKHPWNRIAGNSPHLLPTQEYDYQKYLFWSYLSHPRRLLHTQIICIHTSTSGDECILPIVVNKKAKRLFGLSHFEHLDYDDIVAATKEPSKLKELLQITLEEYRGYHIYIPNINEHSLLYTAIPEHLTFSDNCVQIPLPDNYDAYIHSLSKHQQQNVRTAYNRMSRTEVKYHLVQYNSANRMSQKMWKQLCLMHHERHNEIVSRMDLLRNPYYHILRKGKNSTIYVLFDNDIPMAYMAGLMSCQQNIYYVPRLCINKKYAQYSPGVILLCETIKQLIAHKIDCIDLMMGDEPYKLAMGGSIHKNYYLDCNVNNILS